MATTKPVRPEYLAMGRRIKAGMQARNLDQSSLARALGVEPQSVQQWISGRTAPRGYRIRALAELLAVQPWELLGDKAGGMARGDRDPDAQTSGGMIPALRRVPRVSWVSAGQFRDIGPLQPPQDWDTPSEPMSEAAFSLRVDGDSMEPEFPCGCIIFVEPRMTPLNGDFVVVTLDNGQQATFKQFVVDGTRRYLKPVNPRYPILPLEGDADICGVVREMRKGYRRPDATA